ncbi:hypothetical protein KC340_g17259, partial [Hortaea werneckii]
MDFTNMTVQLVLKNPPNTSAIGRVRAIVAGQHLELVDVFFPSTGQRFPTWTIQSTAVADLNVLGQAGQTPIAPHPPPPPPMQPPMRKTPQPSQAPPTAPATTAQAQQAPQPSQPAFIDPAILSYGKSPAQSKPVQPPPAPAASGAPATPVKAMLAKAAESLPANGSPFVAEAGNVSATKKASRGQDAPSPNQNAQAGQRRAAEKKAVKVEEQEDGQAEPGGKKKTRRGQKKKAAGAPTSSDPPPIMNIEVSRNGNNMDGSVKRGQGWRQTPLLQPAAQSESPVQQVRSLKQNRKQREQNREMQNGWATEEATDVQDMGDFDFEASNKLFDKKTVFDEL